MRALISGSPNSAARHAVQLAERIEKLAPAVRGEALGFDRYSTGSPDRAELHALVLAGQEAAPHSRS